MKIISGLVQQKQFFPRIRAVLSFLRFVFSENGNFVALVFNEKDEKHIGSTVSLFGLYEIEVKKLKK